MMVSSLLLLAIVSTLTIAPEQLGPIPRDCDFIEDYLGDGANLEEVEAFADCLVEQQEPRQEDIERGVALYRLALDLSKADTLVPPRMGDLRYKIVRAHGIIGDVDGMIRETEALSGFIAQTPATRCDFFGRLAVHFEDWGLTEAAETLGARFDLSTCPRYVPRGGWSGDWKPAMYERWFGNQLVAMGERPLSDQAALEGASLRYRLLVLPSFRPAFSARIDLARSGEATLTWTKLDGAGGYDPGEIASQGGRALSAAEAREFGARLTDANLREQSQDWQPRVVLDPDGSEVLFVCADGTQAVVELLDSAGHILITRHGCEPKSAGLIGLIKTSLQLLPTDVAGNAADQLKLNEAS